MRFRGHISCGLLALFMGQGCEQRVSRNELGNVNFELPKVPGADKPPPTPELDELEQARTPPPPEAAAPPSRKRQQYVGTK